jgi:hypothetical protein
VAGSSLEDGAMGRVTEGALQRVCLLLVALGLPAAYAELPCVTYEGHNLPTAEGWTEERYGGGANLKLTEEGLVIDGWASIAISDFFHQDLTALPGLNQYLRVDWRLRVDQLSGFADPGMQIASPKGSVILVYQLDRVYSLAEVAWVAYFPAGEFHDYTFISGDMETYTLYVDGGFAWAGEFHGANYPPNIEWGDYGQGAASISLWDYVRYAIIVPGDTSGDGTIGFEDINPFVAAIVGGMDSGLSPCALHAADVNQDGAVDFGDINPFVELLTTG